MGEIFKGDASVIDDDSLGWLEELTLAEPYLEDAPLRSFMVILRYIVRS